MWSLEEIKAIALPKKNLRIKTFPIKNEIRNHHRRHRESLRRGSHRQK